MADTPDFLMEQVEKDATENNVADKLDTLQNYVDEFRALLFKLEQEEYRLKTLKEQIKELSREKIPSILLNNGLSELRLASGDKVIIKEEVRPSVTEENKPAFFKWLESIEAGDLIKNVFYMDRMEEGKMKELFMFLMEKEYGYTRKQDVHPQTLIKFFKEYLGIGKEDYEDGIASGKYKRIDELPPCVSVFVYNETKLK